MPPPRVLIVDDEPLIRWCLAESLTMQGCEVTEAGTVEEARAGLASEVDALLLDVKLPDGDGISLLRQLRAGGAELPIVIMTAHGDGELARVALSQGAQAFVAKPFDVAEVTAAVLELARASTP